MWALANAWSQPDLRGLCGFGVLPIKDYQSFSPLQHRMRPQLFTEPAYITIAWDSDLPTLVFSNGLLLE